MEPTKFEAFMLSRLGLERTSVRVGQVSIGHVTPLELATHSQVPSMVESMNKMYLKHNDPYKKVFQIALKTLFISSMKSVGIVDPVFSCRECKGSYCVTISMTVGSRNTKVVGDLRDTAEMAEDAAIDKAIAELKIMDNILVKDISTRKEKALIRSGRKIYHMLCSGLRLMNWVMMKWKRCSEDIGFVLTFAYPKQKEGTPVVSQFADVYINKLLLIRGAADVHIDSLEEKITALTYEIKRYVAAARAIPFCLPEYPVKKARFDDVEALAVFSEWLQIDECRYSAEPADGGMWFGVVEFTLPPAHPLQPSGIHKIVAAEPKRTIAKAHNAAARDGIGLLEELYKVDVSGYNHSAAVYADKENFVWNGLKAEVFMLGGAILNCWEDMLRRMNQFTKEQKMTCTQYFKEAEGVRNELIEVDSLVQRLEGLSAKCTESFKVAASKFNSLE